MRAGILRRGGDLRPGARAAEGARVAPGIECGDLSPMREMRRCHERIHRLLSRTAGAQQCQAAWSKPRIGAMLGAHGSYSGLAPRDGRSTAIADVATAAPIRPVRGQRPMSEKVIVFMLRSADVREPGETASLDGGNIIPATGFLLPLSLIFLHELFRWAAGSPSCSALSAWWYTFLVGASFSWSIAIIVTRAARPRMSMFELLPWCFAVSAVMLLPLLLWHAPHGGIGTGPVSWAALGYIGLIAGPIGTWCVMQATAMLPTVVSSVGFLATPAISLLLANVFLGERFTVDLLVGSALIVGGVGFAAWPGGRR
jgi:hypothetical protein